MNHLPLVSRKPPHHAMEMFADNPAVGHTADPFAHIDCPICRAMLQKKIDVHRQTAAESKSQERAFFEADGARVEKMLAQ